MFLAKAQSIQLRLSGAPPGPGQQLINPARQRLTKVRIQVKNLWTLGGLSPFDLLLRTIQECWEDSVFGQGGRMTFYHFLAIFPTILVSLSLSSHLPHVAAHLKNTLVELSRQLLPDQAWQLFQTTVDELNGNTLSRLRFLLVCAGASWAFLNATWATIYGLNRAYEVPERRSWWELGARIAGLTFVLALLSCAALFLTFCSEFIRDHLRFSMTAFHIAEWLIIMGCASLWFAVLYRLAPNLPDAKWQWSTPGAVCALLLWAAATFGARFYFNHLNDYSRTYGHLNSVVMILLWLYISNGAILIGGEMNSEIEKAVAKRSDAPKTSVHRRDDSLSPAAR